MVLMVSRYIVFTLLYYHQYRKMLYSGAAIVWWLSSSTFNPFDVIQMISMIHNWFCTGIQWHEKKQAVLVKAPNIYHSVIVKFYIIWYTFSACIRLWVLVLGRQVGWDYFAEIMIHTEIWVRNVTVIVPVWITLSNEARFEGTLDTTWGSEAFQRV